MTKTKLIPKITSLMDLRNRAKTDTRYLKLAIAAAENLGGQVRRGKHLDDPDSTDAAIALRDAMDMLNISANETDEDGVVDEVNYCRDLIDVPNPVVPPKPKGKTPLINIDLVRSPILQTWSAIASDWMQLEGRHTNAGAIEGCIDADRLTMYANKAEAKIAEAELDRAIKAHGYTKVLNTLSRAIRLI
jgi:hypothetical protein